jgi:hypothetical protein
MTAKIDQLCRDACSQGRPQSKDWVLSLSQFRQSLHSQAANRAWTEGARNPARRVDQCACVREAGLHHQERGEAALSSMDDDYAFGEMDEAGKANIADFAARSTPRCSFEFMPVEGRDYFMRKTDAGP